MRQASEERNSLTRVVHFAAFHKTTKFGNQVYFYIFEFTRFDRKNSTRAAFIDQFTSKCLYMCPCAMQKIIK